MWRRWLDVCRWGRLWKAVDGGSVFSDDLESEVAALKGHDDGMAHARGLCHVAVFAGRFDRAGANTPGPVTKVDDAVVAGGVVSERAGALVSVVVIFKGEAYAVLLEERDPVFADEAIGPGIEGAMRRVSRHVVDGDDVAKLPGSMSQRLVEPFCLRAFDWV